MSLTPALGRQRQVELCLSDGNLVYGVTSKTARDTKRSPVSKPPIFKRRYDWI
ncbi:hypothetical protein LEMLEM_LOCUS11087 [Lemmus lemmus]